MSLGVTYEAIAQPITAKRAKIVFIFVVVVITIIDCLVLVREMR